MLFHAPGAVGSVWRAFEGTPDGPQCRGRPVLLVDPRPSPSGEVLVYDGREEWTARPRELAKVAEEDVGPLSRVFAHDAASPSP